MNEQSAPQNREAVPVIILTSILRPEHEWPENVPPLDIHLLFSAAAFEKMREELLLNGVASVSCRAVYPQVTVSIEVALPNKKGLTDYVKTVTKANEDQRTLMHITLPK